METGGTFKGIWGTFSSSIRNLGGASSSRSSRKAVAPPVTRDFSGLDTLPEEDTPSKHQPATVALAQKHQLAACAPTWDDSMSAAVAGGGASTVSQSVRVERPSNRAVSPSTRSVRMARGDSASSTTVAQATCPVAMANLRIRQDLYTLGRALEQMLCQVKNTNPLGYWQVDALHRRFDVMYRLAVDVHRHEEECVFPTVCKHNARLCESLQCQNTTNKMLWFNLRRVVVALRLSHDSAADFEALRNIAAAHAELCGAVRAHCEQVDAKLLPLIHKVCGDKELADSDARLLKDPTLQDWAHFLSVQPDDNAKKAMMQHMGASRITSTLVLLHGARQYAKHVGPLFQDLKNGFPGTGRGRQASSGNNMLGGVVF